MQKKLTIMIDEEVYSGLYRVIGSRKIGRFVEELVRPYVIKKDRAEAYRRMAEDAERENEALEWSEHTVGDSSLEEK